MRTSPSLFWGIDLGGTKTEIVVLDEHALTTDPANLVRGEGIRYRHRLPTGREHGYRHILSVIAELVRLAESATGQKRPTRLGIGTPGALDPQSGKLKNSNTQALQHQPLQEDLEELLQVKLSMANDANCFALAEATLGAARGYETVFGTIMGTGCGGGLVVRGHVLNGLQGIAGEWGHNSLDAEGPACYCGRRGCLETLISGPALEAYYRAHGGEELDLKAIHARHLSGSDPLATQTIHHLCDAFGRALAQVINVLDPHAVVLGGGVGNIAELQTLGREVCARHVFNTRLETPLLKPALGDSAGVFGAAMLTLDA